MTSALHAYFAMSTGRSEYVYNFDFILIQPFRKLGRIGHTVLLGGAPGTLLVHIADAHEPGTGSLDDGSSAIVPHPEAYHNETDRLIGIRAGNSLGGHGRMVHISRGCAWPRT